jgi:hypothetical protein
VHASVLYPDLVDLLVKIFVRVQHILVTFFHSHENDIFRGGTYIFMTGLCSHEITYDVAVQAIFYGGFELS